MYGQAKPLEPLKYQAFDLVRAGTGMPVLFLSNCFYLDLYGQAPIYK